MNYYFEIRKDKRDMNGLSPIRLVVSHSKTRIRRSIKAKAKFENWDKSSFYIKNPKGNKFYQKTLQYNELISSTKIKVDKIFKYFEYNEIPFSKKIFLEKFEKSEVKVSIDFHDAFDEYIETSMLTKTKSTITKIKSVRNFIINFQKHSSFDLRFDNIDFRFEEEFQLYCFTVKRTLNNYYAKIIKTLKAFLNWALGRGYHNSLEFKKIKAPEDDIEVIYLTIEELMKLYHHNFKNKSKDRARDMFCFLAFTGQRHCDIRALQDANIVGEYLNFTVIKTKTVDHQVYLTKYAKELIKKYINTVYYPIPRISSSKLNEKIKECCEEVGITQKVILTRYIGSQKLSQTFNKYDLVTSHVGRKTFITNSLVLGANERVVKSVSNHKDDKSFRKYVHTSKKHKQKQLEVWNTI